MSMRRHGVLLGILLCSTLARAQAASTGNSPQARAHFDEGLARAGRGELQAALQEFEAAYQLQPHYSVLYNIAQAEAALGRSAEAVETFDRYLREGADRLSAERRDEVQDLIGVNRARLGELRVLGLGAATRIWLDGTEISPEKLEQPVLVSVGEHSLLSSNGDGFPRSQQFSVQAASRVELHVDSVPVPAPAHAQLLVSCRVPGVSVEVAGLPRATTPILGPLKLPVGTTLVRFFRAGYRPVTRRIVTSPGAPTLANCDQSPEPTLEPALKASLVVQTSPADAELFVDGDRFLGAALPFGPHELRVERDGFVTQVRPVSLRPRETTTYRVSLTGTPSHLSRVEQAQRRRKLFGYVTAGGGLAFVLTGAGLFVWNGGRYDDWQHANPNNTTRLQGVASIQRVDDFALGAVALGTGLVATGTWLLLTRSAGTE